MRLRDDTRLSDLLRLVAREMESDVCVLWELASWADLEARPPTGQLHSVESTFLTPEHRAQHALMAADFEKDFTGRLVSRQADQSAYANTLFESDATSRSASLFAELRLTKGASACLKTSDGRVSALSVYRVEEGKKFTPEEAQKLEELAFETLALWDVLAEQQIGHLISRSYNILYGKDWPEITEQGRKDLKDRLHTLAREVSRTFHCHEVSIYLHDWLTPQKHELQATTLPREQVQDWHLVGNRDDEGLSGWILTDHKDGPARYLRIPDLQDFRQPDRREVWRKRNKAPKLDWKDGAKVEGRIQDIFGLNPAQGSPPLAFLAVQIRSIILEGMIRCSLAKDPYYFSQKERVMLQRLARVIAEWWDQWMTRREKHSNNVIWQAMLKSSSDLNEEIHKQVARISDATWDETAMRLAVFKKASRAIFEAIPGGSIVTLRVRDRTGGFRLAWVDCIPEIYSTQALAQMQRAIGARLRPHPDFATTRGKLIAAEACLNRRPISKQITQFVDDGSDTSGNPGRAKRSADYGQEARFFSKCEWLCSAPIALAGEMLGVIDVGFMSDYVFLLVQDRLEKLLQMVGRNIGVYEYLLSQIRAQAELKRQHLLTYANVSHQIKSPLRTAVQRADWVCRDLPDGSKPIDKIEKEAARVRGLCQKAFRVAKSMELHAKISQGRQISCTPRKTPLSTVAKTTLEALIDGRFLIGRHDDIEFSLDANQIEHPNVQALVDLGHWEQVVDAVVNNAFKYSNANSEVRAKFLLEGKHLALEITNHGIHLCEAGAKECVKPGWRAPEAQEVDQDGSGLGCWLASTLMEMMGGGLEAKPTDKHGDTTFRLILPVVAEQRTRY